MIIDDWTATTPCYHTPSLIDLICELFGNNWAQDQRSLWPWLYGLCTEYRSLSDLDDADRERLRWSLLRERAGRRAREAVQNWKKASVTPVSKTTDTGHRPIGDYGMLFGQDGDDE